MEFIASANISGKCFKLNTGEFAKFNEFICVTKPLALADSSPLILGGTAKFQAFQAKDFTFDVKLLALSFIKLFHDLFAPDSMGADSFL